MFEALEASHVPPEETIILPDMIRHQNEQGSEFIAENNLLWGSEGAKKHTPSTANKATQSQGWMGCLTFDPRPPSNEVKDQAAPEA